MTEVTELVELSADAAGIGAAARTLARPPSAAKVSERAPVIFMEPFFQ